MKNNKPNILMVVENSFPIDSRVRKEAYHLSNWYRVTVIALKRKSEKFYEVRDEITIIRFPELPDIDLGKIRYMLEYSYFTLVSLLIFLGTVPFKRYRVVHVHNPPDTLFVLGIFCKLLRIRFIFDHHDLAPNLYLTRFSGREDLIYKILILCERYSCRLANIVIATNNTYKELEIKRHGIDRDKIYIVRNNPIVAECVLGNTREKNPGDVPGRKKVLLFIGSINPQDGLEDMLRSIHLLITRFAERNFICNIVGGGDSLAAARKLAASLEIEEYVNFTGEIYDRERIKKYFHEADIGLEPAPENDLNLHSTFIKVMEYMAAGIPTVAFDLKETRFSAGESAIFVPPGDLEGFARAVKQLLDDDSLRKRLGNNGSERIGNELNWEKAAENLRNAYSSLSL